MEDPNRRRPASNHSPSGGRETDWIVTTIGPDDMVSKGRDACHTGLNKVANGLERILVIAPSKVATMHN